MTLNIARLRQTLSAILLPVLVFAALPCRAELQGDKELVLLVANGFKANFDSLTSWRGQASVQEASHDTKGRASDRKSTIEYAYDRDSGASRWSWRQMDGRVNGAFEPPYVANGMVKDDRLYRMSIIAPGPRTHTAVCKVQPKPDGPLPVGGTNDEFHPLYHMKQIGWDTYGTLMWYYQYADNPNLKHSSVSRKGTLVTLEINDGMRWNRYVFDTSQGCNMVTYVAGDALAETTYNAKFTESSGVFVPVSVNWKLVSRGNDQTSERDMTVDFIRSEVNANIDPSEFSLDSLGMLPGDRVHDDVSGLKYEFKPEAVVLKAAPLSPDALGSSDASADGADDAAVPASASAPAEAAANAPARAAVAPAPPVATARGWKLFAALLVGVTGAALAAVLAIRRHAARRPA
jgi:hypothetical protein